MTQSIMIQGTMSNAGKSLLVAGLCRIFAQDGYRVAPFKSQNMALNSFVTDDGLEMGRAQVMQAEAAGIVPEAIMNPILLKPTSHVGSQVIVKGEVLGNMTAEDYYRFKDSLRPLVADAYATLAQKYDIIVLEGAGSPAEINLRDSDLVNMGMAEIARAPVVLAGDIDLGGVFAQLYGTVSLLKEDERSKVKGLVVNKFRGDKEILRPGLAALEELCGSKVLGVVPYMKLDLDDEDSLAPRLGAKSCDAVLDVAVVRLPHLSNFTDFNRLSDHDSIGLRYVEDAPSLGRPDLVILPGTKNTMVDMRWLHERGFVACIRALGRTGTPVIGICGGYQMLGTGIVDPEGIEVKGQVEGLGLLPMQTTLTGEKTRTRLSATLEVRDGIFAHLAGLGLEGYEIHMGRTKGDCPSPVVLHAAQGARADGGVVDNVMGTYLHGFFDADGVVEAIACMLLELRGLPADDGVMMSHAAHKEFQYDLLAQGLRESLDMDSVYRIVEAGL